MSKFSRSKGQRGERTVAKLLQERLSHDVTRELSASRDGGCDIKIQLGDITYLIEVKFHTKVSQSIVAGWWDQAIEQAKLQEERYLNPVPVLIYKQTHWKKWECRNQGCRPPEVAVFVRQRRSCAVPHPLACKSLHCHQSTSGPSPCPLLR